MHVSGWRQEAGVPIKTQCKYRGIAQNHLRWLKSDNWRHYREDLLKISTGEQLQVWQLLFLPGIMLVKAIVLWPINSRPRGLWSHTSNRTKAICGIWMLKTRVSSHMGLNPEVNQTESYCQSDDCSFQRILQLEHAHTIIIHYPGLLLARVTREADNLHLNIGIDNLKAQKI